METFFKTRDITQNEVLIFRDSPNSVSLMYSHQAFDDAKAGIIRPSVHLLHSKYSDYWFASETGEPILSKPYFYLCTHLSQVKKYSAVRLLQCSREVEKNTQFPRPPGSTTRKINSTQWVYSEYSGVLRELRNFR